MGGTSKLASCVCLLLVVSCGEVVNQSDAGEQADAQDGPIDAASPPDAALCGNGDIDGDEECDDGNDVDNDDCTNQCTDAICGDGITHDMGSGTEECDDANGDNTDDCVDGCVAATCGDGFVQAGAEDCDPPGAGCSMQCQTCMAFAAPSYDADIVFTNSPLQFGPTPLAWDGTNLWTGNVGSGSGKMNEAQYQSDGTFVSYYHPAIDFRSMFVKVDGTPPVLARAISSRTILRQVSPIEFTDEVELVGGTIDAQAAVVFDSSAAQYVTHNNGVVSRWSETGTNLSDVALQDYGTLNGESDYPNNRGVAAMCGYYLTYSNGVLSAWDSDGVRVGTTTLNGAGVTFNAHFSYGAAMSRFWVVDDNKGSWRGYNVGL